MTTYSEVRHISITIDCSPAEVYAFAANPQNLPRWASGLSDAIECVDGEWVADSPMGKVKVRFAEANTLGVLDHDVILESGASVHNPMRVVANGTGSEVIFTLFRRPEMSDEEFVADAGAIARDLATLERILK